MVKGSLGSFNSLDGPGLCTPHRSNTALSLAKASSTAALCQSKQGCHGDAIVPPETKDGREVCDTRFARYPLSRDTPRPTEKIRCPPFLAEPFKLRVGGGIAVIVCDNPRHHCATGIARQVSCDRGGWALSWLAY